MKLAFVAAANSPHTVKWVNALVGKGHTITLYTMPDHQQQHGELHDGAEVVYLPANSGPDGIKQNTAPLKLFLKNGAFDAVVAMDLSTYAFMAIKAKAKKLLAVSTGLDVYNAAKAGNKAAVLTSVKKAIAIAATAPNIITKIKELYKKEKQYFVTPFGVDMEKFNKKQVERGQEVTFGSIKFLEPWNSVDLVIEAFARFLSRTDVPARLKIVGDGSQEDALKQKVESLGIQEMVEFLGYVNNDDMPDVINTMDVAVQMTAEECFGVSGVEAMACEVPLVASDTVGASEYILNGVTGHLVKAGNVNACGDKMIDITKNPQARAKMGEACREDMLPLYDLKDCVEKFEEALNAAAK